VARERERENKDVNRVQQEELRVFQKGIATRQNRAGVIREIQGIRDQDKLKYATEKEIKQWRLFNKSSGGNEELQLVSQHQQPKKINIFDEGDSNSLKHETLARLGFEGRNALIPLDDDSDLRSQKSHATSAQSFTGAQKPKALEYLQKARDQKESVKDFISNTRNILTAQIAINDKTEETERLKEYIIMEKEKLEEAKKTFEEDRDKFQKYLDDLTRKADETASEVQRFTNDKNERLEEIAQLQLKIQKKKSKIKQIKEKLVVFKQHKEFLDTLAVTAGKKPLIAVEKKETKDRPVLAGKKEQAGSSVFMTQVHN